MTPASQRGEQRRALPPPLFAPTSSALSRGSGQGQRAESISTHCRPCTRGLPVRVPYLGTGVIHEIGRQVFFLILATVLLAVLGAPLWLGATRSAVYRCGFG